MLLTRMRAAEHGAPPMRARLKPATRILRMRFIAAPLFYAMPMRPIASGAHAIHRATRMPRSIRELACKVRRARIGNDFHEPFHRSRNADGDVCRGLICKGT